MTGPIKSGTWHLVGDGIPLASCDVTYELLWREASGTNHSLATWTHHFDPQPTGYTAVQFEADGQGLRADASANDLLVLRMSAQGDPSVAMVWIPNGDGAKAMGRIPSLTLPK
jgi:hypothetical protein